MSKDLLNFGLVKAINTTLGIVSGFYVPLVIIQTSSQSQSAVVLTLFGISSLFLLLDFGLTKPLFNLLKVPDEKDKCLKLLSSLFLIIWVVLFIFIWGFFAIYNGTFGGPLASAQLILYALAVSFACLISLQRPALSALGKYVYIEKIEVCRRLGTMLCFTSLFLFSDFTVVFLVMTAVNFALMREVWRQLSSPVTLKHIGDALGFFKEKMGKNALNNWLFTICELIIYNAGYYSFPFFMSDAFIISYSIYMRMLAGIYLLGRFYPDIRIWFLVDVNRGELYEGIIRTLAVVFVLTMGCVVGLFVFGDILVSFFYGEEYVSIILSIFIGLYALGNSVRHLSGGLLTYRFGLYRWMSRLAVLELVFIAIMHIPIVCLADTRYVIGFGFIYVIFSVWIARKMLLSR